MIANEYECAPRANYILTTFGVCLVPVRRFPKPSRSIHFGDVSEVNERETSSLGPHDPKGIGRSAAPLSLRTRQAQGEFET